MGVVRNVSNKNNINVLLDGNGIPFYFDHVSKKLLVDITLKDGVNEIEIQASNSADPQAIELKSWPQYQ